MKSLYKILSVALVAAAATSCEDELVKDYTVDKPESVENAEYLNTFGMLKDYVNKSSSPNFRLGAAVQGAAFTKDGAEFILAKNNFDEVFPAFGWNFSECAGADGNFDFGGVSAFVNKAQSAGLEVFGAPFCWSAGQNCDYLATLVKDKPDPNAKSNFVFKFTQAAAKDNAWDSNFFLTWDDPLELETEYIVTFKAKATKAVGLQLELMDPSGDKCAKWGTDEETMVGSNSWEAGYSSHSDVPQYGVNVDTDWTTITLTYKTKKDACDGYLFKYTKFQFGTGKLEGDLLIDDVQIYKKDDPDKKNYVANSTFDDDDITMYSAGARLEIAAVSTREISTEYTDEVRCLKIDCPAKKSQTWDSQLWIKSTANATFKEGVSYKFHCKARADVAFTPGTGIHGDPDGNNWMDGGVLNGMKITPAWQEFNIEGTFSKSYEKDGNPGYTMAFDLSIDKDNVIYLDDISLEIGGTEVIKNGSFDSDDVSSFVLKIDGDFSATPQIFDGSLTYTVTEVVEVGGIPQTIDEKRENIIPALENWIGGLLKNSNGYVKNWCIVSEPLSEKRDDKGGEDVNISGNAFTLQSSTANVENKGDKDVKKNFYWGEHLGKDYVRDLVKIARKAGSENGVADLKLFVNESRLESNPEKLQSLLDWIAYWEKDGTKIDGIGTEMHISFYSEADKQKEVEDGIVEMFNKLKDSGKLVKISELDMKYINATGYAVKTAAMTTDMHKQMSDFYKFIVKKYREIIPADKQAGICLWSAADVTGGEPLGLWTEGYQRKMQYAGFVEGLQDN